MGVSDLAATIQVTAHYKQLYGAWVCIHGPITNPLPTQYPRLSATIWRLEAMKWRMMQTTDLILLVVLTQLMNQ